MKWMRVWTLLFLLAIPAGIIGCGGGGAKLNQQTTTSTLGKELQDLDDAFKKGLIEEKEYKNIRKDIIKKYTK